MSSPFQQKFSAKSPLNGNYYSGVDGLQYVSPKIPESKTPAEPSKKTKTPKTPEIPETKKTFDFGSIPPDLAKIPETPADVMKNREEIINQQTLKREIKGKPVEKFAKKGTPEYDRWLAAVKKNPSIEDKYKDRTLYQDQEQTGFTENGETTLSDWMNVGEEYEK